MNSETYGSDLLRAAFLGLLIGLLLLGFFSIQSHQKVDTRADIHTIQLEEALKSCQKQLKRELSEPIP